ESRGKVISKERCTILESAPVEANLSGKDIVLP
ncbi:hypothetical protein C348_06446, partial [Cryptococcus neoformans Gb118]